MNIHSPHNLPAFAHHATSTQPVLRAVHQVFVCGGAVALLLACTMTANAASKSEARAESLLAQMTLAEKIGQMTQVDSDALKDKSHVQKYFLGSVLSGGGSDPADNSPQGWLKLASECQSWAGQTRLKIPLLYGVD